MKSSKPHSLPVVILVAGMLFAIACTSVAGEPAQAQDEFEIVAVKRVDKIDSNTGRGEYIIWGEKKRENGVLFVLKYTGNTSITYFSSDFSLGYEDEAGIPRSPCVGISLGSSDPDVEKATWMLGGFVSRYWASKDKPYFGVIFPAPKAADKFTLFYAAAVAKDLKATK